MITRPTFIVFEGLDGSGKSTCAARLAEHLGATLMTTPSPEVRLYRDDLIRQLGAGQEARQLFYLATVFSASDAIAASLAAGRSVVLDRYFLSTMAYAAFRGSRLAIDEVNVLLRPADITFYLDTPLETRVARLAQRHTSAADLETMTPEADLRLRTEHLERAQLPVVGRFVRLPGDGSPASVLERAIGEMAAHPRALRSPDAQPARQ